MEGLDYELRPAAHEPAGAIVLMHGRGADRFDLLPVLDALDPDRRLTGVTPEGPFTLPPGGRHWYAVRQIGYPDPATFGPTYEKLSAWLDALPELTGVPLERTILGGFSQGTVMSWATGLGEGRPAPAGILALSGFMPTVDGFSLDLADRAGFSAFISHGEHDQMIGVEWGRQARDRLEEAGAAVEYHEHPGAHHVDPRQVPLMSDWVARTIASAAAI